MSIAAALFALTLLFARTHRAGDALFAPEKGLKVEHTARAESSYGLEDWSCAMNGQAVPKEYLPSLDVRGSNEIEIRTTDTHLACAAGKPTRVRRAFEKLSAKQLHEVSVDDAPRQAGERLGSCALQGCVVLLDEAAGDGAHRKLEQGKCEQELVDALAIDLDLTEFVPADGKADAWDVPASALNLFDEHFGGIEFAYDKPEEQRHSDPEQLARNVEGAWHVQRGAAREDGGVRVLPLALTAKLTSHCEIDSELKNVPVASGPTTERAEMTIEAKGELLWDLQHHVLHGLSLESASTMTFKTRTKQEGSPGTALYTQDMTFRGSSKLTVETTVAD